MHKRLSELMTTEMVTLHPEDNLNDVAENMDRYHLRHIPVVDGSRLVGLVSHRDLLRFAASSLDRSPATQSRDARIREATFVEEIMTHHVETASPDRSAAEAARILVEARFGCLPVVDSNHNLLGIVTEHDLLKLLVGLLDS